MSFIRLSVDEMVAKGVPRAVAERSHAENVELEAKLATGVCPKCSQPGITATRDERQAGAPPGVAGMWVQYRHPCGYMIDAFETLPQGAPS